MGLGTRCMIFAAVLLVAVSTTAQTQCPNMPPGTFGPCVEACGSGCTDGTICCSNGCGHECMRPVGED
ncbi:hypothetical protein R5R35_008049 [Gryllus longicercus]|uniref:WAP domain-containing protein n=1 Tax=Gryllus longicercus TaxID=2509291 RepID=A0AAN9VW08_9ORTH